MAGFGIETFGVRIGLRFDRLTTQDWLDGLVVGDWRLIQGEKVEVLYSVALGPEREPRRGWKTKKLLYRGAARLSKTLDEAEIRRQLRLDLQGQVSLRAKDRVFIHAGVVGWQGKAIVLPGRSYVGKTTLVDALLELGGTYYSDEYAVLDSRGRVNPFPRPLRKRGSNGDSDRDEMPPASRIGREPIPVALVVDIEYQKGRTWQASRISPGQGMLTLFANAVAARSGRSRVLSYASATVASARMIKGIRGEATEAARILVDALESG